MKPGERTMQFFTSYIASFYSFFERFEMPNSVHFSMKTDTNSEPIFFKSYAFVSKPIVRCSFLVTLILRRRTFSKIAPPVVCGVYIFVIHKALWPFFCFQKPRYMVRHVGYAIYRYLAVAFCDYVPGADSGPARFPNQVSSFGGIGQNRADVSKCQALARSNSSWFSRDSHSILLRSGWSEAGWSASNALLPRFSIAGAV
jgi:hypothetical protein